VAALLSLLQKNETEEHAKMLPKSVQVPYAMMSARTPKYMRLGGSGEESEILYKDEAFRNEVTVVDDNTRQNGCDNLAVRILKRT